jgi:hypothetical protein
MHAGTVVASYPYDDSRWGAVTWRERWFDPFANGHVFSFSLFVIKNGSLIFFLNVVPSLLSCPICSKIWIALKKKIKLKGSTLKAPNFLPLETFHIFFFRWVW